MPLGRIIGNGHGAATTPHCGEGLRWGMTRAMLKDFPGSASNVMKVLKLGSGLIDYSKKITVAARQTAEKKVWAQRS